jgi:hypothetical protein
MLWDIRARMRPVMSIIDLIPNVHRTPAAAALRRAVLEARPAVLRLTPEERELAYHDANVPLTSPIGARVLKALYQGGHLKLKKPGLKPLPALDAYIATEAEFRAEVERLLEAEEAKHRRLAEIIADPDCALPEELSPWLIDKVITARLGHGVLGDIRIAGLTCHRGVSMPAALDSDRVRPEARVICWWLDAEGNRQGDPE